MNREALDSLDKEALIRLVLKQAETIAALTRHVERLTARVAELEAKLGLPPKTPDNSSTPPSQGRKPSADQATSGKGQRKSHPGTHRSLHPDPTRKRDILADHCQHWGTDVSGVAQTPFHAYDHIELPEIKPDVTRVTLHRGFCPCCGRPFRAEAPAGLEPGSPFGPNLRAFAIYLRFVHAISFERLARLMSDLVGLAISEGALVAMLADSRRAFARQASLIRARLLAGSVLQSDETACGSARRTGGCGLSTTARTAASSSAPAAARMWSPSSSATCAPPSGSPIASARRWAGPAPTTRSASLISCATPSTPPRPATSPSPRACASCCRRPARSAAAGRRSPTPPCGPTVTSSTPNSMGCSASSQPMPPATSCSRRSRGVGASCSPSSPTAPSRPPTTAPNRRCGPASSSARSRTASGPNGPRTSMPTSAPSSKPPAGEPSASLTPFGRL